MFPWLKKEKGDKTELELDTTMNNDNNEIEEQEYRPTDVENSTVVKIENDFADSRGHREGACEDSDYSVEDNWEDEYNLVKGGGLQWYTNFTNRKRNKRKLRPNSENNFILPAITTQLANITAQTPLITIVGVSDDDIEIADKLTFALQHNDTKNEFSKIWKVLVLDFITSGPTIMKVIWDDKWQGGRGPERWVGDVREERVDKWDMYFDPSIIDLENRLQDCSYIIHRPRKKIKYFRDNWERGKLVNEEANEDHQIDEGANPRQADLIEYWHRGFPWFMPDERKKELEAESLQYEQDGEPFKAKDYEFAAKGDLQGIHVAYVADGVLLEYKPYEYEHGKYPFVFTTRYHDDKNPMGYGEVRNIKIPQIMHNKADEIEIEAMTRQGLGGNYYQKGGINTKQIDNILENNSKPGAMFEVDNIGLIKDRNGVQVPSSITRFKEDHQRMVETISANVPAQQMDLGKNVPFATIQELGARSDVRMQQISNKLEDFLIRVNNLKIELFGQFYTEDRYYRVRGENGEVNKGKIKAEDLTQEWTRDTQIEEQIDPVTGQMIQIPKAMNEKFIPEFDIKVVVVSEKPTDRNYYTNLAMQLYQMQLLVPEDLLSTLEKGKLPPMDDILKKVYAQQPIMQIAEQLKELPPEMSQQITQQITQMVQGIMQQAQGPQQQGPPQQSQAPIL